MRRALEVLAPAALLIVGAPSSIARAFPDFPGTRALGMGGGGRADARGNEAPLLNPAAMSLARVFTLEGAYQHISNDGGYLAHVSVVDSRTSDWNLAGGIYYTYRSASPPGVPGLSGHEAGISLSLPFTERLMFGVTGKYVRASGGPPEGDGGTKHAGFTADVGAALRPARVLTLGVVGYNLRDLATRQAPVAVGYGIAVMPIPDLALVLDGLHDFTTHDDSRGVQLSFGGGAELVAAGRVAVRAGGGHDGASGNGFVSGGLAAVFDLGAFDVGVRQDIEGARKVTYLALGLRLFVPQSPFGAGGPGWGPGLR